MDPFILENQHPKQRCHCYGVGHGAWLDKLNERENTNENSEREFENTSVLKLYCSTLNTITWYIYICVQNFGSIGIRVNFCWTWHQAPLGLMLKSAKSVRHLMHHKITWWLLVINNSKPALGKQVEIILPASTATASLKTNSTNITK